MNEIRQSKKISVGLVLSWIFGSLFALTGVISIFSDPVPGIIILIMAGVLLPPINKLIDEKWNFHLSKGIKVLVIIICLSIFGSTVDTSNNTNQKEEQLNNQIKQNIKNIENQKKLIEPAEIPVAEEKDNKQQTENQTEDPVTTTQPESEPELTPAPVPTPVPTSEPELTPAPTPTPEPTVSETVSQRNAVRSAKTYLNYSGFSYDGLVDQLEYEQFSHVDAVYGVDNCGADWNEQAAKSAQTYMEYSAFSRGSLIEQLKYDKFTQTQAEYGANAVGL